MSGTVTRAAALSAALLGVVVAGRAVEARQPADVAAKLSGTWVLNRDLSSGFGAPGRGRGAGATASQRRPGALFAATAATAASQRGGGGGAATPAI